MPNVLKKYFPHLLLGVYLLELAFLAISPYDRITWIAENLTAFIPAAILCLLYWKNIRFSNTAYFLMAVFLCCHTVGGHFTFERVPFDFVTELFGFQRNHFDRMCHFMVGFFAYPVLEYIEEHHLIKGRFFAAFMVVMGVFGFAAIFELIEWLYAEFSSPASGSAFLGSQGDIWDAQKDMLCDGLGAITTTIFYSLVKRKVNRGEEENFFSM